MLQGASSECRSAGVPECRSAGVPECRSAGVPDAECRSAGVPSAGCVPPFRLKAIPVTPSSGDATGSAMVGKQPETNRGTSKGAVGADSLHYPSIPYGSALGSGGNTSLHFPQCLLRRDPRGSVQMARPRRSNPHTTPRTIGSVFGGFFVLGAKGRSASLVATVVFGTWQAPNDAYHVSAPGPGSSAAYASVVPTSSSWSSSAALITPRRRLPRLRPRGILKG